VVELEAIGPVPFCAMLLGDLGAEVIRIDRIGGSADPLRMLMGRNRRSIAIDLKHPEGPGVALRLIDTADVLLEGMRPGVVERLGVGPERCLSRNPRLVYGRMTGWGQDGPWATRAGHDIDYIAATGALHAIGAAGAAPPPPLNLVGDFGGGALYLALGVLAALFERGVSRQGQVVDAAMIDGASSLMTMAYEMRAFGLWGDVRGHNLLDGGAPFYTTYETADGGFIAVGALEPQFYADLLDRLGLVADEIEDRTDPSQWEALRSRFATIFASRTREEWSDVFEGSDACVEPVATMAEAPEHPQLAWRGVFVSVGGTLQPGPAPRFRRTPPADPRPAVAPGHDTDGLLTEVGYEAREIAGLRSRSVVG
jgi:alpha-methylacyl-CoA racemase